MQFYTTDLKDEFPMLKTGQTPILTCYINDTVTKYNAGRRNKAILIIPGGAYARVAFNHEGEQLAFKFLEAGFNVYVLTYSVAPEHFPVQLTEAAASLAYIRRNAELHRTDTDKIAICGFSAGGHLAASLGVFYKEEFLRNAICASLDEITPNAMILGYPVISADEAVTHIESIQNVAGTANHDSPEYKNMSLESHISPSTPPAFIWHTADDKTVNSQNSLLLADALAKNKVKFELHIFPHGPHGISGATEAYNHADDSPAYYCSPWTDEAVKFLKALWKGELQ